MEDTPFWLWGERYLVVRHKGPQLLNLNASTEAIEWAQDATASSNRFSQPSFRIF